MSGKTNKSAAKRFRVTRNLKVLYRRSHQDHFNAKESGDAGRRKRKQRILPNMEAKKVLGSYLPPKSR